MEGLRIGDILIPVVLVILATLPLKYTIIKYTSKTESGWRIIRYWSHKPNLGAGIISAVLVLIAMFYIISRNI